MKFKIKLFIALLIIAVCTSCNGIGTGIPEVKLIPVLNGKEYQYIDQDGKIVINPQFGNASVFRNGLALVRTSGDNPKYGFITEDGKYSINANYLDATIFSDDLAWVVSENSAPTAINNKGEVKITLQDAQNVNIFKEGLAAYSVSDSSGEKWGFVDLKGKIIINPQFYSTGNFSNGKCAVKNKAGKWGYIDKDGKIIINHQFDKAAKFVNGKAVIFSGEKAGLIDDNGKYLINPQFSDMVYDNEFFLIKQDNKWGWCDSKGKIIINPQFVDAFPFLGNDLAAVKSGENYGYIDKQGKIVINPQFNMALPYNGKLALVSSSEKIGFIDREGKFVINPQFDDVSRDLAVYLITGSTTFESVHTDYFNIGSITKRISNDITDRNVAGMNFNTPMSAILLKYNKSADDFKYSSQHKVVSGENISSDATLDFYILGSPWNWVGYNYSFDPSFNPVGYGYVINLTGNGYGKEDNVFKALQAIFTGYNKDTSLSTDVNIVFKNNYQLIRLIKGDGITIAVLPLSTINQKEQTTEEATDVTTEEVK